MRHPLRNLSIVSTVLVIGLSTASTASAANYVPNPGFNLYRQQTSKLVKLNRALISSAFGGSASGHAYSWLDRNAPKGAARYRVQAVSLSGKRSWVGAAVVAR